MTDQLLFQITSQMTEGLPLVFAILLLIPLLIGAVVFKLTEVLNNRGVKFAIKILCILLVAGCGVYTISSYSGFKKQKEADAERIYNAATAKNLKIYHGDLETIFVIEGAESVTTSTPIGKKVESAIQAARK